MLWLELLGGWSVLALLLWGAMHRWSNRRSICGEPRASVQQSLPEVYDDVA